eukprot:5773175-Pleurochrysis_carterae.AAC.1
MRGHWRCDKRLRERSKSTSSSDARLVAASSAGGASRGVWSYLMGYAKVCDLDARIAIFGLIHIVQGSAGPWRVHLPQAFSARAYVVLLPSLSRARTHPRPPSLFTPVSL